MCSRLIASIFVAIVCLVSPALAQMREYDSKYYVIHTDLDPDDVRECIVRMTKMAEEYHERTKGFAGDIRTKLPFFLYRSADDYLSNGGLPRTVGSFIVDESGSRLLAIAGRKTTLNTWHTVQHEGFHQFAHAVIGGEIPTWLNEGLAEYFGESIFTGDGFVTGIVPPWRLARLQGDILDNRTKSLRDLMEISSEDWLSSMDTRNYDQAWSVVHFLVHAENGRYEHGFSNCIRDISKGRPFNYGWLNSIGSPDGFEYKWKQYWVSQPSSPTSMLYAKAAVATLTSFVARATARKQSFKDFNAFRTAVVADEIQINPEDWLPHSLITSTFRALGPDRHPELLAGDNKQPEVMLPLADGTRVIGTFTLHRDRVDQVNVQIDELGKAIKEAESILEHGGKKSDARTVVQNALRQNPKSSDAADARKILQTLN